MAISTLNNNSIDFKTTGVSYAKITSTSDGLVTLTSNSGNVRISGVADPVNNQDVVTKNYVASIIVGGSDTQLQYNNSNALGSIPQWTTNGTTTLTGSESSILDLKTNAQIILGTSPITVLTYNGANTTLTASSGDIIVTNSGTGAINLTTSNTNFVNITYGMTSNNSYGVVTGLGNVNTIPNNTETKLTDVNYWTGTPSVIGDTVATRPTFAAGSWIINKAGRYFIHYAICSNGAGTRRSSKIIVNTLAATSYYAFVSTPPPSGDRWGETGSVVLNLSINDDISVYIYQNSVGAIQMDGLVDGRFIICRLE